MQLSAANLLIAAQQFAKQAGQPAPAQFAVALAGDKAGGDAFAPLDFKRASNPLPPSAPPGAPLRIGAMIDIRV